MMVGMGGSLQIPEIADMYQYTEIRMDFKPSLDQLLFE
jgi:hypothetical protein